MSARAGIPARRIRGTKGERATPHGSVAAPRSHMGQGRARERTGIRRGTARVRRVPLGKGDDAPGCRVQKRLAVLSVLG